ncbi:MAG: hypothetical protein ACOC43_10390, partial [Desulfohalobiaceae bacterium]
MTERHAGESWAEDLEALEGEARRLQEEIKDCQQSIRQLRDQEDPASGQVYAQEIHALLVKKLSLETELEFCRRRKNRLLLQQSG